MDTMVYMGNNQWLAGADANIIFTTVKRLHRNTVHEAPSLVVSSVCLCRYTSVLARSKGNGHLRVCRSDDVDATGILDAV